MIRQNGALVPGLGVKQIEAVATVVRRSLGLAHQKAFCMGRFYDLAAEKFEGFSYRVVPVSELKHDMALAYPGKRSIEIREDIFDLACSGNGMARFTMAHEFGHLVLHSGIPLHRAFEPGMKTYLNSEWQADEFAGSLLMPAELLNIDDSIEVTSQTFGVSLKAAGVRINNIRRRNETTK